MNNIGTYKYLECLRIDPETPLFVYVDGEAANIHEKEIFGGLCPSKPRSSEFASRMAEVPTALHPSSLHHYCVAAVQQLALPRHVHYSADHRQQQSAVRPLPTRQLSDPDSAQSM